LYFKILNGSISDCLNENNTLAATYAHHISGSSSTMSVSSSMSEEQKTGCATGEESIVWAGLRAGRCAVLAAGSAVLGAALLAKPAAFCAELAAASAAFEVIFS
jgi:hypothetical protein